MVGGGMPTKVIFLDLPRALLQCHRDEGNFKGLFTSLNMIAFLHHKDMFQLMNAWTRH